MKLTTETLLTVNGRLMYRSITSWMWKQKKIITMMANTIENDDTEAKKL